MKTAYFFLLPSIAFLALSCAPPNSETQEEQPVGSTIDTTAAPQSNTYNIQVLDAEKPSPRKEMKGNIGKTEIIVNYGSPSVRNRKIWGGLEPYGEVWRSGANEATTIQFFTDVMVEGKPLPKGRYGFFTIPRDGNWTVIFNGVAEQWGDFDYDSTKDLLRVEVTPQVKSDNAEQLDYLIEGNTVVLRWEKIAVPFNIQTIE